jgi:hypothetical protein
MNNHKDVKASDESIKVITMSQLIKYNKVQWDMSKNKNYLSQFVAE